jgi:hypothetical protein
MSNEEIKNAEKRLCILYKLHAKNYLERRLSTLADIKLEINALTSIINKS